ncbi:MAG: acetyl-CoA C-acyltransferase, partial [Chitinophagaceae bacterium]
MKTAYIIDSVRTAIGRYGGALSSVRPDDMLAMMIRALVDRSSVIDVSAIEDVIAGAANQSGEDNRDVARMASLLAGLPVTVGGTTVNRLCASGLQAIMDAARAISCDEGELYIAGGVESMTRAPFVMAKSEGAWSRNREIYDSTIGWRFTNKKLCELYHPYNMGETAENVAKQWNIPREIQDEFAFDSHQKYFAALVAGKWEDEIVPVVITPDSEPVVFSKDECPRHTSPSKLAGLKPAFIKNGTVTAGNSSSINDGAAAMLLASEEAVKKYGLKPMARIVSMAIAGVNPDIMGIGPVPATQKALKRAGLKIGDIDLIELNEAFAVQAVACIRELGIDSKKLNVNGGSIAIGHPLGCSGARISVTLLHEMRRQKVRYGLACMCVGVGQGAA